MSRSPRACAPRLHILDAPMLSGISRAIRRQYAAAATALLTRGSRAGVRVQGGDRTGAWCSPLSAYARAMPCPLLRYRVALSAYARAMRRLVLRWRRVLSVLARAVRCVVLRGGTRACASTEQPSVYPHGTVQTPHAILLQPRYALSGTDLGHAAAYGPSNLLRAVWY
eukprot:1462788-Rhodomonas_salina.1